MVFKVSSADQRDPCLTCLRPPGTGMVFKVSSVDQGLGIYFAWSELEMNRILLDAPKDKGDQGIRGLRG